MASDAVALLLPTVYTTKAWMGERAVRSRIVIESLSLVLAVEARVGKS